VLLLRRTSNKLPTVYCARNDLESVLLFSAAAGEITLRHFGLFRPAGLTVILRQLAKSVVASLTSHDEGVRVNLIKKILTAQVAVLALWAVSAQTVTAAEMSPQEAAIAERIKPVGQVCIAGEECKGVGAVAVAAAGPALTGAEVVAKYCGACHTAGVLGAPKIGDGAAWKTRAGAAGGLDGLLKHAIAGINAMPPKGTCATCSDDELQGAIKQMSGL
jgi:cytochrome c5